MSEGSVPTERGKKMWYIYTKDMKRVIASSEIRCMTHLKFARYLANVLRLVHISSRVCRFLFNRRHTLEDGASVAASNAPPTPNPRTTFWGASSSQTMSERSHAQKNMGTGYTAVSYTSKKTTRHHCYVRTHPLSSQRLLFFSLRNQVVERQYKQTGGVVPQYRFTRCTVWRQQP